MISRFKEVILTKKAFEMAETFTGQVSYLLVIFFSSFESSGCVVHINDYASPPPFPLGKVQKYNITYNMIVDILS